MSARHLEAMRRALARAQGTPFYRQKLDAAGAAWDGTLEGWARLPLTTKDELRSLSAAEFYDEFCRVPPRAAADFWRSGGVTGQPLLYPRTREDVDVAVDMYSRRFSMCGVGHDDLFFNAFPINVHPVGHVYAQALARLGHRQVWAGSGLNTPSEQQVEMLGALRPSVLLGMPSYCIHLAQLMAERGGDPRALGLRLVICCAEALTGEKRRQLKALWGAPVADAFGMSEGGHLTSSCTAAERHHLFADLFHVEVLDEATLRPVPPGQRGMLVVTPLYTGQATPFVRWVTGDLVSLGGPCPCGGPYGGETLVLSGRTSGFWKVRGVNLNHNEVEDALLGLAGVRDFLAFARRDGDRDALRLEVEPAPEADGGELAERVAERFKAAFELVPEVALRAPGEVRDQLRRSVKPVRFFDER